MKEIAILGTGCTKCETLAANAKEASAELGLEVAIRKVADVQEIMKYGVMLTPALVIDGEVKCVGKVMSVAEIKAELA